MSFLAKLFGGGSTAGVESSIAAKTGSDLTAATTAEAGTLGASGAAALPAAATTPAAAALPAAGGITAQSAVGNSLLTGATKALGETVGGQAVTGNITPAVQRIAASGAPTEGGNFIHQVLGGNKPLGEKIVTGGSSAGPQTNAFVSALKEGAKGAIRQRTGFDIDTGNFDFKQAAENALNRRTGGVSNRGTNEEDDTARTLSSVAASLIDTRLRKSIGVGARDLFGDNPFTRALPRRGGDSSKGLTNEEIAEEARRKLTAGTRLRFEGLRAR